MADAITVTIKVSQPYTLVAGGWTHLRPVGRRRDYSAVIDGVEIRNTSKNTIRTLIRQRMYRKTGGNRVNFIFQDAD